MSAVVLRIDPDAIDDRLVDEAARVIRRGGLVAIPTETVYGLGCNALDEHAVARVFEAKGRPASDPLIVHVDGPAMAATVVAGALPQAAQALADAFWPGPLTMVLPRNPTVPAAVSSGLDTVGVRCPEHPVAVAIITAAGVPVAAPSANRFGHISPTSADHVVAELGDRCDVVVDSGRTQRGVESTVVTFDAEEAVVLRHGAVTLEALQRVTRARSSTSAGSGDAAASPGQDERHYSPRTPTIAVRSTVLADASMAASTGLEPHDGVVYAGYRDRPPPLPRGWRFEPFGAIDDLDAVAHDLYDTLRRLDASAATTIVVELTGGTGIGRAIDDRLTRAASSVVVSSIEELAAALDR